MSRGAWDSQTAQRVLFIFPPDDGLKSKLSTQVLHVAIGCVSLAVGSVKKFQMAVPFCPHHCGVSKLLA